MKTTAISILFAACILLPSCDKVTHPVQKEAAPVDLYKRKVLVEDYTGQQCGNCPRAATVADKLTKDYPGKVIVVGVHAGIFAKSNPLYYPASYTTTAGNEWVSISGFGISSFPNGMVNRKNYADNGLLNDDFKWPTTVSLALKDEHILNLYVRSALNGASLTTTVNAKFVKAYPGKLNVTLLLLEDSIIGPQLDYRIKVGDDRIPNYVFMHMLRDAINGSWGTELTSAAVAAKDSLTRTFPAYQVNASFNSKHLAVVAFVTDVNTREVLQVEKTELNGASN